MLAVSDISGGIYAERGLDVWPRTPGSREHGSLAGYPDGERMTNAELLELPCDILVLAALEDQVHAENAPRIATKLIAEGANGPTYDEADAILAERGIPVLPDVLTNAGGVTVSYFEWVQDLGRLFWTRDEIRARLADKLGDAFDRVWDLADASEMTLRSAALVAGIREVAAALECARDLSVTRRVRDAMVADPQALEASASAQEAGELFDRPEVRAVLVCDDGRLTGIVTRKTLVREVVARGRRPAPTPLGEIAEEPLFTLDAEMPLEQAFRELEERDFERVPGPRGRAARRRALGAASSSAGSPRTRSRAGRERLDLAAGVGARRGVALDRLGQLGGGERGAVEDVALADG